MTADHPQLLRGSRWNANRQGDMTQLPAGRLRNCSVAGKRPDSESAFLIAGGHTTPTGSQAPHSQRSQPVPPEIGFL